MPKSSTNLDRLPAALAELAKGNASEGTSPWWQERCSELFDNACALSPRALLRWPALRKTMHMVSGAHHDIYYGFLLEHDFWHERWQAALPETPVGGYIPYKLNVATSPQVVQHLFHLAFFNQAQGLDPLAFDTIAEIGGGYGSLCRLFHRMGHRGRYLILDLPPFREIQYAWLTDAGVPAARMPEGDGEAYAQLYTSLDAWRASAAQTGGRTLLISTWGVSEAPLTARNDLLAVLPSCAAALVAFQARFAGVDNIAAFRAVAELHRARFRWNAPPVPGIPDNYYLFATAC